MMGNFKQHILMVSIDTLRADCIAASPRANSFKSQHKAAIALKTNSLDDILKSSLYFNNCFSAAPYTSASHAAYFTGMWPLHNGLFEFFNRKLNKPTIFNSAKKSGYTTIFQTDFPVILGKYLGFTDSIDHFFVEDEDQAFKTLTSHINDKTLSFFHFAGIHYPYGFHTLKFGGNDYREKVSFLEKKYCIRNKEFPDDVLDETFRNKEDTELLLRYKFVIEKLYKQRKYDELFDLYLEGINYFMEHRFKFFIKKVKKFVDENNAILFIFADHGEEWSDLSEGHHNSIEDPVLRVPLMVYGKNIKFGINDNLVRTIDLAPTISSLFSHPSFEHDYDGKELNIFDKNENKRVDFAISQCWKSKATKIKISEYQKFAIKHNTLAEPLETYLMSEVIRDGIDSLSIYYEENGSNKKKEFLNENEEIKKKKTKLLKLESKLKSYNLIHKSNKNRISEIESKIRNELSNLGYNV